MTEALTNRAIVIDHVSRIIIDHYQIMETEIST
jgi:hypothetical protein